MHVDEEDVRHLYDLVVCSLDYGSGFLDFEDDAMLDRVAEVLNIDRPGSKRAAADRDMERKRARRAVQ